jgi:hypothetical protein
MRATLLLVPLVLLAGCAQQQATGTDDPEEVMRTVAIRYYEALDARDYLTMYGLISEGFKQLEPTARTYGDFEAYMSRFHDTATGIRVASAEVAYATGTEVGVSYVAIITLKDGRESELKSTFTVRKKPEGWRLIHPYGQNIDES